MGIGINLGNTLDAIPNEGAWALAAEQYYFSSFGNAGFKHVRIPITWDDHTQTSAPYAVDEARMDRVEQLVDWALAENLYVIINAHHEDWLKTAYADASNKARFDAIWTQIADRFKDKSPKLLFEILNEPNGMSVADVNDLNLRTLGIIRQDNPTRIVVFAGNEFSSIEALLATNVLSGDYLIGNFHSYNPWPFAGQCTRSWGTQQDMDDLEDIYQRAEDWSSENNIPVTVNEFGVAKYDFTQPENICDQSERLAYLQAHVTFATQRGISATVWDDGGSFALYDRALDTWTADKDILVLGNQ